MVEKRGAVDAYLAGTKMARHGWLPREFKIAVHRDLRKSSETAGKLRELGQHFIMIKDPRLVRPALQAATKMLKTHGTQKALQHLLKKAHETAAETTVTKTTPAKLTALKANSPVKLTRAAPAPIPRSAPVSTKSTTLKHRGKLTRAALLATALGVASAGALVAGKAWNYLPGTLNAKRAAAEFLVKGNRLENKSKGEREAAEEANAKSYRTSIENAKEQRRLDQIAIARRFGLVRDAPDGGAPEVLPYPKLNLIPLFTLAKAPGQTLAEKMEAVRSAAAERGEKVSFYIPAGYLRNASQTPTALRNAAVRSLQKARDNIESDPETAADNFARVIANGFKLPPQDLETAKQLAGEKETSARNLLRRAIGEWHSQVTEEINVGETAGEAKDSDWIGWNDENPDGGAAEDATDSRNAGTAKKRKATQEESTDAGSEEGEWEEEDPDHPTD